MDTIAEGEREDLAAAEMKSVLRRADEAGVRWIVTSGMDLQSSASGIEIAGQVGGVIHNFDEDEKAASRPLDMGFLLSFGGAVTYPSATELYEIIRHIPLDGILIETDSPYMPLYQQEADKNEPANVAQVARVLAELRKIDIEELIDTTYKTLKCSWILKSKKIR